MKGATYLLTALLALGAAAHAGMGEVLASWPSPKYPNTMNANGLAFEGEYIWLKAKSCETNGVLKCTTSGSLIKEISFPGWQWDDSSGMAFDGRYLWTVHHQIQYPYWDFYAKYTTDGSRVDYFQIHGSSYYHSVSVSWDGLYLWTDERPHNQTNPNAEKLTTAGSAVATFPMPPYWETGAGYYKRQLWMGGPRNRIYGVKIGGGVVASFPAPGGSCRAVGFDGEYLWTADAKTPQYIYKVDIDVVDVAPASLGRVKALFR